MFKLKFKMPSRKARMISLEIAGIAGALAGVAHYAWPVAVILAGVLIALAVERN